MKILVSNGVQVLDSTPQGSPCSSSSSSSDDDDDWVEVEDAPPPPPQSHLDSKFGQITSDAHEKISEVEKVRRSIENLQSDLTTPCSNAMLGVEERGHEDEESDSQSEMWEMEARVLDNKMRRAKKAKDREAGKKTGEDDDFQQQLFAPRKLIEPGTLEYYELGFHAPGTTGLTFIDKIINPCLPTTSERDALRQEKIINTYNQYFLSFSMFMDKCAGHVRRLNRELNRLTMGCLHCCPIHCIQTKIKKKVRPGRFRRRTQVNEEIYQVMSRNHLDVSDALGYS
jgi:hypothetical protein